MTVLHIDFETRSTVDLKAAGVDNYAKHPTTDVWCMGFAFDDEEIHVAHPGGKVPTAHVMAHVRAGGIVIAHNAAFELAIWNHVMVPRYGWPVLKPEQCRCTMAMAYAQALPGSLEKAAAAVGIEMQKDMAGHRLMMQMAKPRGVNPVDETDLYWWDEPEKLERLYAYCKTDVEVERQLGKRLMPLSDAEQEMWVLDQRINNRGITIDTKAVAAAIAVVQAEQDRLNGEMRRVTGNYVGFCTETARLKAWLHTQGVVVDGVAKSDVLDALADEHLPELARTALGIRQEAGKSSTAKLTAMLSAVSSDGRLRGMFQYHGAGTGRWAGRRVQLQNLPRPKLTAEEIERCIYWLCECPPAEAAAYINFLDGNPLDVISWALRGMLTAAPGHDLLAADFRAIESRGLAWLAGEQWKLDAHAAFDAGTGPEPYRLMASDILSKPIAELTDHDRQTYGKVPDLACGFQGGVGAFQRMAKTYGVRVSDEIAERAKTGWRNKHPLTVRYWYELEDACKTAVLHPGSVWRTGPKGREVAFRVRGSFLWCLLPSGRALCYPYPKVKPIATPWGEMKDQVHYMTVDSVTNKWVETHTYGGKLAENITQAICRDLLAEAIKRCEMTDAIHLWLPGDIAEGETQEQWRTRQDKFARAYDNAKRSGFPVVLHVHDEIVAEVPSSAPPETLALFEATCSETPQWAAGLPVVAKGWRGRRYRK